MKEIEYKIIRKIGQIGNKGEWKLELNIISWNKQDKKFDIRKWDNNHIKMSKGITLTKTELINLKELLNSINIDEVYSDDKTEENDEVDGIFDET
ncbi:MAG: hypothetical protein IJP71_06675 [Lachnospiraceae bacterium]|nr:hypothetical protein [Lachnospiraceae bacterium]